LIDGHSDVFLRRRGRSYYVRPALPCRSINLVRFNPSFMKNTPDFLWNLFARAGRPVELVELVGRAEESSLSAAANQGALAKQSRTIQLI
jgi:hypothetical protein